MQNEFKKKRPGEKPAALPVVKKYELLVFIGRFQPLHKGHMEVIDKARQLAHRVLVIVGSAGKSRSTRNPFTFAERKEMIQLVYPDVIVEGVSDSAYNDTQWVLDVQALVNKHAADNIGLIGCEKDHTSYYLKLFPQWGNEVVQFISPLNATAIRGMFFTSEFNRWEIDAIVDDKITKWLLAWRDSEHFERLKYEWNFINEYKEKWGEGPFLTADSLVEVGGNILLIRRGKEYGHGLLALPGGFVNFKTERFLEAALRELKEETRLKVPAPVLKGSIKSIETFDDPHRSERGRIVTQCFHIKLENELNLPEVRGSDDADEALWVPVSELREDDFFEDHYHIIRKMLGI